MQNIKPQHVVILFERSLFAAGIASRLAEAGFLDVNLLDIGEFDSTEKVQVYHPEIIVYDASDVGVTEKMCIFSLLKTIPGVHVLQVNYIKEEVQIFCSQQKNAHEMDEFISLMQNFKVSMD